MNLRKETSNDYHEVFNVITDAFENEIHSDHREQFLVERLRKSKHFVPELSIVAEIDNKIVGYILLTKIKIKNTEKEFESLALAPVAVLQEFQNKGIGSELIKHAHAKAKELGFSSIILLGHPQYYPKFGYKKTSSFGIKLPFDVPEDYCMALELTDKALAKVNGMVEYPEEFSL